MLGKFTGKEEANSCLDFPTGDGGFLVVVGKSRGFGGNLLEDVVHEGVHDAHGLTGDASLGVDLLQNLVDVDGVGFLPRLSSLLLLTGCFGCLHCSLLFTFLACRYFSRHYESLITGYLSIKHNRTNDACPSADDSIYFLERGYTPTHFRNCSQSNARFVRRTQL